MSTWREQGPRRGCPSFGNYGGRGGGGGGHGERAPVYDEARPSENSGSSRGWGNTDRWARGGSGYGERAPVYDETRSSGSYGSSRGGGSYDRWVRGGGGGGCGGGRGRCSGGGGWAPPRGLGALTKKEWDSTRPSLSADVAEKLALSSSLSKSNMVALAKRPGVGRVGVRCMVSANHFLVELDDDHPHFHRYDVYIEPKVLTRKLKKDIMIQLTKMYKTSELDNITPAYDGSKNLYTTREFPFTAKDFTVRLGDSGPASASSSRVREFKVTIKWTSAVEFRLLQQFLAGNQLDTPKEAIQVFDVVLRSVECFRNYTLVGRSLFSSSMGRGPLADGLEFWKGFHQSVRPTQMGLSLNIDASARAFYEPVAVIAFLSKNLRGGLRCDDRALTDHDRFRVTQALEGVTIETTHRKDGKRHKVLGLSTQPSNELMFPSPDGTRQSVAQYFNQKYGIRLEFPCLPCLEVGTTKHRIYLPMEVCNIIEGQKYWKKLTDRQVTDLLKANAVRPINRASQVKNMVDHNGYNRDYLVRQFGIQVRNSLTFVEARVLPPPTLIYDGPVPEATVDPSVGQWSMSNQRLHEAANVKFWACLSFSQSMGNTVVEDFCEQLLNECRRKGMNFAARPLIQTKARDVRQFQSALFDVHTECTRELNQLRERELHLQLLIIILPDSARCYGMIKRICEAELGIVSQCCVASKVGKAATIRSYLEYIALKINVKVGGRNVALLDAVNRNIPLLTEDRSIIFGADVTHAQPGEYSSPSIAAVVASMDWPCFSKYKGLVSAQPHRTEIILNLSNMVKELLLSFGRLNGDLPRRIIFYRDGVSESEFAIVLLKEMGAIRDACKSLQDDYLPPVTFVVVQKRHHTRFFPEDRNMTDRIGNILPGTVVDSKICHPSQYDFYLCSHAGIHGTSRPAHYHVLFDENNLSPDLLQLFTNSLCYTYARCTSSVSRAFRARFYLEGEAYKNGPSIGGAVKPLPELKEHVKNVMYYC